MFTVKSPASCFPAHFSLNCPVVKHNCFSHFSVWETLLTAYLVLDLWPKTITYCGNNKNKGFTWISDTFWDILQVAIEVYATANQEGKVNFSCMFLIMTNFTLDYIVVSGVWCESTLQTQLNSNKALYLIVCSSDDLIIWVAIINISELTVYHMTTLYVKDVA